MNPQLGGIAAAYKRVEDLGLRSVKGGWRLYWEHRADCSGQLVDAAKPAEGFLAGGPRPPLLYLLSRS